MKPKYIKATENIFRLKNKEIFLGEFTNDEKTEIVTLDDDGNKSVAMKGVAVYRLIDKDHKTIAQQDPSSLITDLTAVVGKKNFIIAYVQPPYNNINEYHWKVMLISEVTDPMQPIIIKHNRIADSKETKKLNKMFPGWLDAVKEFDRISSLTNTTVDSNIKH